MTEYRTPRAGFVDQDKRERDPRLIYKINIGQGNSDAELWNSALTVCDPLYGLDKKAATEILIAMGLKDDPGHTKMNWLGRMDTR